MSRRVREVDAPAETRLENLANIHAGCVRLSRTGRALNMLNRHGQSGDNRGVSPQERRLLTSRQVTLDVDDLGTGESG